MNMITNNIMNKIKNVMILFLLNLFINFNQCFAIVIINKTGHNVKYRVWFANHESNPDSKTKDLNLIKQNVMQTLEFNNNAIKSIDFEISRLSKSCIYAERICKETIKDEELKHAELTVEADALQYWTHCNINPKNTTVVLTIKQIGSSALDLYEVLDAKVT